MEITQELLETIFNRAVQYHIAKYGNEPDKIQIEDDGTISGITEYYYCGSHETDSENFSASNLTEDLDEIARQRKVETDALIERQKKEALEREKRFKEEALEKRRQEYLQLKKEFE